MDPTETPQNAEGDELEAADGELLPDREAMSVLTPTAISGAPDIYEIPGPPPEPTT